MIYAPWLYGLHERLEHPLYVCSRFASDALNDLNREAKALEERRNVELAAIDAQFRDEWAGVVIGGAE